MLLRTALETFFLAIKADGFSTDTILWYENLLNNSPHSVINWLIERSHTALEAVDTNTLRDYVLWVKDQKNLRTGAPLSEYTVNAYIRAAHKFFKWGSEEYDVANPMKRIRYPKNPPIMEPKTISLEAVQAMFACQPNTPIGLRNRAMMAILIDCGPRSAGIRGMRMEHLDLKNRQAKIIEKRRKVRTIYFTEPTTAAIYAWTLCRDKDAPSLFYNIRTLEPFTRDGFRVTMNKIAERAGTGEKGNPHRWRHTFATLYMLYGGDPVCLSRITGHADLKTLLHTYTNPLSQQVAENHREHTPMNRLRI